MAATSFVEKHPKKVEAILKAHIEATNFINQKENYNEAVNIGVKYTAMDEETVKLAMKGIYYEFMPSLKGELEYVAFLDQLGQIKIGDPKLFVNKIIESSFLEKILGKR